MLAVLYRWVLALAAAARAVAWLFKLVPAMSYPVRSISSVVTVSILPVVLYQSTVAAAAPAQGAQSQSAVVRAKVQHPAVPCVLAVLTQRDQVRAAEYRLAAVHQRWVRVAICR